MTRGRYGFGPAGPADMPHRIFTGEQPPVRDVAGSARSAWATFKLGLLAVVVAQAVSAAVVSTSSGHSAFAPIGQALRVLLVGPASVEASAAVIELDERPADGGEVQGSGTPSDQGSKLEDAQVSGSTNENRNETPAKVTPRQIAVYASAAGFRGQDLTTAVAVALAESGGRTGARCYNTGRGCSKRATATTKSTDRGLWQINDRAWPDIPTACADDPACAARQAWRISRHGKTFRPWSAYKSGRYARYLDDALAGILGRHPTAAELTRASRAAGVDYRRTVGALPSPVERQVG